MGVMSTATSASPLTKEKTKKREHKKAAEAEIKDEQSYSLLSQIFESPVAHADTNVVLNGAFEPSQSGTKSKKRRLEGAEYSSEDAKAGANYERTPSKRYKRNQDENAIKDTISEAGRLPSQQDGKSDSLLKQLHKSKGRAVNEEFRSDLDVQNGQTLVLSNRSTPLESVETHTHDPHYEQQRNDRSFQMRPKPTRHVIPGVGDSSSAYIPSASSRDLGESTSPFVTINVSFKVTIPPIALASPLEGVLAQYISPLLLTYHSQLEGILMAYNNARLKTSTSAALDDNAYAQSVDECAAPYIWLNLDVLVFRPKEGVVLEGQVNLQNETQISLLLWNHFQVSINRRFLPKDWRWHDYYEDNIETTDADAPKPMRRDHEQWGVWYDGAGHELQGSLRFRIVDWECAPPGPSGEGSFMSVEGSLLTEDEEREMRRQEDQEEQLQRQLREQNVRTPSRSALRGSQMPGISQAGTPRTSTPAPITSEKDGSVKKKEKSKSKESKSSNKVRVKSESSSKSKKTKS